MSDIATNIGQSKHLLELGLDPASADMEYCYIDEFNSGLQVKSDINVEVDDRLDRMFGVTHIPAWSLSALLEVMREQSAWAYTTLAISSASHSCFMRSKDLKYIWQKDINAKSPLNAAYEMVCWLLTNNLITNK